MGSALLLAGLLAVGQPPQASAGEHGTANTAGTDLQVGFDGADRTAPGQQFGYALHLINLGPEAAVARATVRLPGGTTFVRVATRGMTCDAPTPAAPRVLTCGTSGSLRPRSLAGPTLITVTTDAPAGSSLTATAVVSSDQPDVNPADNSRQVVTNVM
ncbi:hypothetical protein AB0M79_26570 [Polymorphospora sp. NPDC051019]|uniref:hypothetical protein n=1 Tax=Polymorphospora sp. NPDC051019 TaxID=3155725 RepID=UPI003424401A